MLGWNVFHLEEFSNDTSDLVATYADWEDFRTDLALAEITRTVVTGGKAQFRLQNPTPPPTPVELTSVTGAVTREVPTYLDVVPDQSFQQSGTERNKWTAVADFYTVPLPPLDPLSAHIAVFIRVNNRDWNKELPSIGTYPDQTRFGCYINGNSQGVLQFTGDDLRPSRAGYGNTNQDNLFQLIENPFASSGKLYRVQIIERQVLEAFQPWKTFWKAEVYNITDNLLIGSSSEINEFTITGNYQIDIPALASSKLGMGFGAGKAGGVDVERTGTSYWSYV
ncbi:MAG TPA: hypothetical protein VGK99_15930 [Acidobacteriota bacterium]|jgi:hypothetical protein